MRWPDFTPELIASFTCQAGLTQSIYRDGACPGLGVRVTELGVKSFVFESQLRRVKPLVKMRMTIGDVRTWSLADARLKAAALKRMTDLGIDPRKV